MKTCFSEGKLTKQFGNLRFRKSHPLSPPPLSNPLIYEEFFHDLPLCPNFKNKKQSLPVLRVGLFLPKNDSQITSIVNFPKKHADFGGLETNQSMKFRLEFFSHAILHMNSINII